MTVDYDALRGLDSADGRCSKTQLPAICGGSSCAGIGLLCLAIIIDRRGSDSSSAALSSSRAQPRLAALPMVGSLSISASYRRAPVQSRRSSQNSASGTSGTSGRFSAVSTARALERVSWLSIGVLPAVQQVLFVSHLAPSQGELLPCSVVDGCGLMSRSIDDVLCVAARIHLEALRFREDLAADLGSVIGLLGQALAGCPLQFGRLGQHRLNGVIRRVLRLLQLGQHALSLVCDRLAYRRTVAFSGSEEFLGLEGGGLAHAGDSCFGFGANGLSLQASRGQELLGIGSCACSRSCSASCSPRCRRASSSAS